MLRRALTISLLLAAASFANAGAQSYAAPTVAPRTTDPGALAALARRRELHERFVRGFAAEERGDWSTAQAEFLQAVALGPPEPQGSTARYDLALAEANLGHDDAAAAHLQEALHLDPSFAAAAANLVAVELRRGDLAAARAAGDQFVAIDPQAALARYGRGLVALRGGDLEQARTDFRALLDADPAYAVAHYDLALVELRAGRDEAALTELIHALALAPAYARARFALGTVLLRDGRRADARLAFDRCAHDAADPTLRALAADLRDKL
ncbi:MAG: tetratricopeptide repeat protein [Vulcanimicrobiaceae bacterium]